ncbi:hypothetical protein PQR67_24135 [Paraburkholderia fungorum]|uniref:hypothetical protein n=1 Tax=Paraburkholderia fungorum TaxID=134537 RepID=UPI0038B95D74
MNLTPFLLPGALTLALVAMFAYGLYAIATKDRPTRPDTPTPAPVAVEEPDEWEACAPYPDYVTHPVHESSTGSQGPWHPFGQQEAPVHASHAAEARHDLHDAIGSLMGEPATPEPSARPAPAPSSASVLRCPRCLSSRIDTRNRARKAGSTIGSVAGATGGMAAAFAGAETGAVVGSIAGPVGTVFGGLAGAVIAGLLGSAAGCAAGSAVGGAIDDNVLDNHQCLSCGHTFSAQ